MDLAKAEALGASHVVGHGLATRPLPEIKLDYRGNRLAPESGLRKCAHPDNHRDGDVGSRLHAATPKASSHTLRQPLAHSEHNNVS